MVEVTLARSLVPLDLKTGLMISWPRHADFKTHAAMLGLGSGSCGLARLRACLDSSTANEAADAACQGVPFRSSVSRCCRRTTLQDACEARDLPLAA